MNIFKEIGRQDKRGSYRIFKRKIHINHSTIDKTRVKLKLHSKFNFPEV